MRIAFVCPFGVHAKGTVPARVLPAARSLARRGHQVLVLIPPWDSPEDAGREEREDGLQVWHLPLPLLRSPWGWPALAWRLAHEACESKADVLHFSKPKGFSGWAHAWAYGRRGASARPLLAVDSDDWEGPGGWNDLAGYPLWMRGLFAWQERWGLRHADLVTVPSRVLAAKARGLGVAPDKVLYLPNALPGDHPALKAAPWAGGPPGPGRRLLLYSRLWEFDHARVARRLARLSARLPGLELWMAGRGRPEHETRWQGALAAEGLAGAIRWLGWVDPPRLPEVAVQVHAALVPLEDHLVNRARFPAKILDLMALGLPIAADPVGEVPEALAHGEAGLLLPQEQEAWTEALAEFLHGQETRLRLGACARARVREAYLWSHWAEVLERSYAAALESASRASGGGAT
ncbi:MAG: glycosyltransferase [Anaerolineae bacterium]